MIRGIKVIKVITVITVITVIRESLGAWKYFYPGRHYHLMTLMTLMTLKMPPPNDAQRNHSLTKIPANRPVSPTKVKT